MITEEVKKEIEELVREGEKLIDALRREGNNSKDLVLFLCTYMSVSYNMLLKVHDHCVTTLATVGQDIIRQAHETGEGRCTTNDLSRTNLVIGGYEIDDVVFMRKTAMEFFHYGRISMDVLFQIVNVGLLGDEAYSVEDKGLLRKLLAKLTTKPEFATLLQLMDTTHIVIIKCCR